MYILQIIMNNFIKIITATIADGHYFIIVTIIIFR